jgi:4-amino-4-deoxy-L-arabinose transferase-like glycosyltransferase
MSVEAGDAGHEARELAPGRDATAPACARSFPSARWAQLTLVLLTILCLLPFSGKAFHIDDPIFLWTAQHVTQHPLDPYGFNATWWSRPTPMWQIQQNPPLAAYYMAAIGSIAGWSERALHLGFILPAIVVVLATYRLALRLTSNAFLAAAATLVAPGFLVSATGLMCDVSMVAVWMTALLLWVEGLDDPARSIYLVASSMLIAVCGLTKYFGVSLLPLLFAYSWFRQRRLGSWIGYLAIPVLPLAAYEFYTRELYGYALIWLAAGHPSISGAGMGKVTVVHQSYFPTVRTAAVRALVGMTFAGGCALPALAFVPQLWSRRQILWGGIISGLVALGFLAGWIPLGTVYANEEWVYAHRGWIALQLLFYVAGGLSILGLALADFWKKRSADSLLLLLWVLGTMSFALVVNWDVNARSLLPMIPAAGILIARRLDSRELPSPRWQGLSLAAPLIVCGAISLWTATGDMALANTARMAANYIHEKTKGESNIVWFEGRWGFEYYMQQFGARPVEPNADQCRFGDLVVIPKYNTTLFKFPLKTTQAEIVDFDIHTWVTPMNPDAGAGFYFSGWGALPFVFGPVPPQRYLMARVLQTVP